MVRLNPEPITIMVVTKLTVQGLIDRLKKYDPTLPIMLSFDGNIYELDKVIMEYDPSDSELADGIVPMLYLGAVPVD